MILSVLHLSCRQEQVVRRAVLREDALRALATKTVTPEYPADSLKRSSQGVVVVRVGLAVTGKIDLLEVLQAPDPAIARAVRGAVEQWTFSAFVSGATHAPVPAEGKLFFYFQRRGDKRLILSAGEAAAVRSWSANLLGEAK